MPPIRYIFSVRAHAGGTLFFGGWNGFDGTSQIAAFAEFDSLGGVVGATELPGYERLADGLLLADDTLLALAIDWGTGPEDETYELVRADRDGMVQWAVPVPLDSLGYEFGSALVLLADNTVLLGGRGDYYHSSHAWVGRFAIEDGTQTDEAELGDRGNLAPLVAIGSDRVFASGARPITAVGNVAEEENQGWVAVIRTDADLSINVAHLEPEPTDDGGSTACGHIVGDSTGAYVTCFADSAANLIRLNEDAEEVWRIVPESSGPLSLANDGGVYLGTVGYDADGQRRCVGTEILDCDHHAIHTPGGIFNVESRRLAFYKHFRDRGSDIDGPICLLLGVF